MNVDGRLIYSHLSLTVCIEFVFFFRRCFKTEFYMIAHKCNLFHISKQGIIMKRLRIDQLFFYFFFLRQGLYERKF